MKNITIQNLDGTIEEVGLVNAFEGKDISRNFCILSRGEALGEEMYKVYMSEVIEENPGVYKLVGITDENVWDNVKSTMKEIAQSESFDGQIISLDGASLIKLEDSKTIGLKAADFDKLLDAYKKSSSFTVNEAVVEPTVDATVVTNEYASVNPLQETVPVQPVQETNIFDQSVPSVENNVSTTSQYEEVSAPTMESTAAPETVQSDIINIPLVNEEVQGGQVMDSNASLDTPQDFFNREEQNNNSLNSISPVEDIPLTDDPAMANLYSLIELVEGKNNMIKALTEKVNLLDSQLKASEEARKILEAQKQAAESTIQAARNAEMVNNGGPTLTLEQQNYGQAA